MEQFDFSSVDINDVLLQAGHEPSYTVGDSSWYISPFREERTPSFQVRGGTVFKDWGDPSIKGGVLDLCSRLWSIPRENTREIFQRLENLASIALPKEVKEERGISVDGLEDQRKYILAEYPLNNPVLINYLSSRGIDPEVATKYTNVLVYRRPKSSKKLYGIGFPNRSGGYEFRNKFFKGSFAPKDISILASPSANGNHSAIVFEGFIDALSYLSQEEFEHGEVAFDCVVLNGIGLVHSAIEVLQPYQHVYGLLDNDHGGDLATAQLIEALPNFTDRREWIGAFNDVNEKLVDQLTRKSHRAQTPNSSRAPKITH